MVKRYHIPEEACTTDEELPYYHLVLEAGYEALVARQERLENHFADFPIEFLPHLQVATAIKDIISS